MAHGFTQTSRVWGTLDRALAGGHQVVAVDMPGHGGSSELASTLVDGALQLARVGGRASYLGYSMGARFCLHLALARPDMVDSLVLISGTGGIDDPDQRRARRRSDEVLADRLDPGRPLPPPSRSRSSSTSGWPTRCSPTSAPMRPGSTSGSATPGPAWPPACVGPGPGLSSRCGGCWTGWRCRCSSSAANGTTKFTALGSRMAATIGANATLAVVPGTGHSPHLQDPDAVAGLVRAHLDRGAPG